MEPWPVGDAILGQRKRSKPSVEVDQGGDDAEEVLAATEKQLKRKATGKAPMQEPEPKKAKPTATFTGGKLNISGDLGQRR